MFYSIVLCINILIILTQSGDREDISLIATWLNFVMMLINMVRFEIPQYKYYGFVNYFGQIVN